MRLARTFALHTFSKPCRYTGDNVQSAKELSFQTLERYAVSTIIELQIISKT